MSEDIGNLICEYKRLASSYGEATSAGDHKSVNYNHDKLAALLPRIMAVGEDGKSALLALAMDEDAVVACWAATHSLSFDEKHALAILIELSKKSGPVGFDANMVIQQWRKGKLVLP